MSKPAPIQIDYAILGGGAAGLSMLCHLHWAGALEGKRLLIVEPQEKTAHDRTWSYWERGEGPFESIVHHRWSSVGVHNYRHQDSYPLAPLTYKLIRSSDFYAFCQQLIDQLPNVNWLRARATDLHASEDRTVSFRADDKEYRATWAFSSLPHPLDYREVKQPYLDQHFRGWFIRSTEPVFDPDHATLMDFRTPQMGETRFFYVLPFSPTEAMVEVAIFSNQHLTTEGYDKLIADYLRKHWPALRDFSVYHTEQGVIPMTTYPFPHQDGHLIYIGLSGGYARPSTGYTFYNLQRKLAKLAATLAQGGATERFDAPWPGRHLLYDATLLDILQQNHIPGAQLFPDLFRRNPIPRVLDFLNGETTLPSELLLMQTTNVRRFGSTFIRQLFS